MMRELILASVSPTRRRLLADAGVLARAVPSHVDESAIRAPDAPALARALALAKARAVGAEFPDAWVLGADQVAHPDGDPASPFGKPDDAAAHLHSLKTMVGRSHVLVTAFAIVGPDGVHVDSDATRLTFRGDLTDDELTAYVATGEGSGCCAGYAAEGRGAFLLAAIEGDFFNVLGLPVLKVIDALRAWGWRYQ